MKNKSFNIFKIEYNWCEGEHEETFMEKDVDKDQFERDLIKAKEFAESLMGKEVKDNYLGKGYSVECLPEYYEQIIWFLTNKMGYIECYFDDNISYHVDDNNNGKGMELIRFEKDVKHMILK